MMRKELTIEDILYTAQKKRDAESDQTEQVVSTINGLIECLAFNECRTLEFLMLAAEIMGKKKYRRLLELAADYGLIGEGDCDYSGLYTLFSTKKHEITPEHLELLDNIRESEDYLFL